MTTTSQITNASILTSTAGNTAQTSSTSSSQSAGASSSASASKNILGKQDFLKLLVTQLKNQDPLNPDNPTEFTAQLAQFSSLEQLYNLNTSMNGMVTANTTSNNVSALGLIGKQVTYAGSTLSFDGQPVQLGYTLDGSAAQVQLLIQDSTGNTIRTLPGTDVTSGNHLLTWDGLDQNGNPVQSGTYTVSVQAAGADGASAAASPLITSEVTGVDLSDSSGAILNTKAGNIAFSKVLGVGSAGSSANSILNQTTTESTTSSDSTTAAAASALASSMAQNATNTTSSIL